MSRLWTPPQARQQRTKRYTAADLCAEARQLGCKEIGPRTVRTFMELGLLGRRGRDWPGRGGGSSLGWWSQQQFDLWRTLLLQREQLIAREGQRAQINIALCTVVVGAWLYLGEAASIPLAQVKRAMHSWAKAHFSTDAWVKSQVEAHRKAKQAVDIVADASATTRRAARGFLAEMLYTGHMPGRDELLEQLSTLIDPSSRSGQKAWKGPAEAPLSAQSLTDMTLTRAKMLERLTKSASALPDGVWEWARFTLLLTRGWYQDAQPRLADDPSLAKYPELARLYQPDDFESMINSACADLLSVLALADLAKRAAHLPPEQRPDLWIAGQVRLWVESHQQLSALLRPDGSYQAYVGLSMQLTWRNE